MKRDPYILYNEGFKRIRNKLRKYPAGHIIGSCLQILPNCQLDQEHIETYRHYPPWMLLLLIKWTLVHGKSDPSGPPLDQSRFNELVNLLHELNGNPPLPSDFDHHYLFLRKTAYQQFWFGNTVPTGGSIARQYALFDYLERNHRFRSWVNNLGGISIETFLDLSFALTSYFVSTPQSNWLTRSWFDNLQPEYTKQDIDSFLSWISADPSDLSSYLIELEPDRSRDLLEFHEQTPLIRFPLLRLNDRYYCYNRAVLNQSINNFLFDRLREYRPKEFMDCFGLKFQHYIESGLKEFGASYIDESKLHEHVGHDRSVVDFVVREGPARILIETKGVELGHRAMTDSRYDYVFDRSKRTAIRGVVQGFNCANTLFAQQSEWISKTRTENYLLIVTYKPTFLGSGIDLVEDGFRNRIERHLGHRLYEQLIPTANIYFISVHDWDLLVSAITQDRSSLSGILSKATARDSRGDTKRFSLEQHISSDHPNLTIPSHLRAHFDEGTKRLEDVLRIKE